jgi:hypothetical protein
MAGTGKKWLTGCGIGCGLMILIAGGVGTCGYLGVKNVSKRAETLDEGFETLRADYGRPGEFVPAADGAIPAERLELFLAIRDDLTASREDLAGVLTTLDGDAEGGGGVIAKIRGGITLIPRLFDFIDARNAALVEQGMGLGEYVHIYTAAYFAWLDKDPADGPSFQLSGDDEDEEGGIRWGINQEDGPENARDARDERIRRYLHGLQRKMVGNQLTVAEAADVDPVWVTALREEAGLMDRHPRRLLWSDGLPSQMEASLAPYRERLEATYSSMVNAVEMGMVDHE